MPAALDHVQTRIGDPRSEPAGVTQRHAWVLFAGDDERRLGQAVEPRQARPPGNRAELKGVAEQVGWPPQAVGRLGCQQAALAFPCARRRCTGRSLRAVVGGNSAPVWRASPRPTDGGACRPAPGRSRTAPAGARRSGARRASSWARPPPHEYPSTSTRSSPDSSSSRSTTAARAPIRIGRRGRCDTPAPGGSKPISSSPAACSANGAHISRCAPIPVISSNGRPSPYPRAAAGRPPVRTTHPTQGRAPRVASCGADRIIAGARPR